MISGIPEDSTVSIDGKSQSIDSDTVEFSVDLAGKFLLTFKNSLYLDTEVKIEATA